MTKESEQKNKRSYGVGVPYLSFQASIDLIEKIYKAGSDSGSIDVISRVTGNSTSSSSFVKKIQALKGFGLISQESKTYTLSPLSLKFLHPQSPQGRANAIIESFCQNEYLQKIWEKYKGKLLAQHEFLANYILTMGVPKEMSGTWAEYFFQAALFAGILHERETGSYMVMSSPAPDTINEENIEDVKPVIPSPHPSQPPSQFSWRGYESAQVENQSWGTFTRKRMSNGQEAIFAIPDNLTQEDVDSIKKLLESFGTLVDGFKSNK